MAATSRASTPLRSRLQTCRKAHDSLCKIDPPELLSHRDRTRYHPASPDTRAHKPRRCFFTETMARLRREGVTGVELSDGSYPIAERVSARPHLMPELFEVAKTTAQPL